MFSKMSKTNKILIISILFLVILSSTVFAVYKVFSLGDKKLNFQLILSNEVTNPTVVNAPKLVDGMIPVKWDNSLGKWVITTSEDELWYNYDKNVKRWANVMMSDGAYNSSTAISGTPIDEKDLGSMFVWIPRYEYKITYTNESQIASGGTISINFIDSFVIDPTNGYTIHPAFKAGQGTNYENGEWSSEISGFWMAKFEMSKETYSSENLAWETEYILDATKGDITIDNSTTRIVSKPNKEMWTHISIGKAYSNSKLPTYSLTTTNAEALNSHMMKNSEWGAVSYLGYSEYGKNSQPNINNYMPDKAHLISGYAGDSPISTVYQGSPIDENRYSGQEKGVLASTTGTIYGVYDMNGGTNEFTAAYFNGGKALDAASSGNERYYTVYTAGSMETNGKIGDATKETYNWDKNAVGDSSGPKNFTSSQYFMRGGGASNGNTVGTSGLFSFFGTTGDNTSFFRGFRTVLIIE